MSSLATRRSCAPAHLVRQGTPSPTVLVATHPMCAQEAVHTAAIFKCADDVACGIDPIRLRLRYSSAGHVNGAPVQHRVANMTGSVDGRQIIALHQKSVNLIGGIIEPNHVSGGADVLRTGNSYGEQGWISRRRSALPVEGETRPAIAASPLGRRRVASLSRPRGTTRPIACLPTAPSSVSGNGPKKESCRW